MDPGRNTAHLNILDNEGLTFFLSLAGSLRALTTNDAAEGMTDTFATLFCTVSFTVTRSPFQSLAVSLAISSPIFLGERPRGPIFGANDEAAPTSPPVRFQCISLDEVVMPCILSCCYS